MKTAKTTTTFRVDAEGDSLSVTTRKSSEPGSAEAAILIRYTDGADLFEIELARWQAEWLVEDLAVTIAWAKKP